MVSVCLPSDALLQHLPSYLGFSYLGRGVSLHGCSSKAQLLFQKVGETARPFRCDLNQIPYDYTVEVRNGFKGLYLIDRVPEDLWMEICDFVQEAAIKTTSMKLYRWRFMTLHSRQGSSPSPRKINAKRQNGYRRWSYK